jgi:hypothetical protein
MEEVMTAAMENWQLWLLGVLGVIAVWPIGGKFTMGLFSTGDFSDDIAFWLWPALLPMLAVVAGLTVTVAVAHRAGLAVYALYPKGSSLHKTRVFKAGQAVDYMITWLICPDDCKTFKIHPSKASQSDSKYPVFGYPKGH